MIQITAEDARFHQTVFRPYKIRSNFWKTSAADAGDTGVDEKNSLDVIMKV